MNIRLSSILLFAVCLTVLSCSGREAGSHYPRSAQDRAEAAAVVAYVERNAHAANELVRIMDSVYDTYIPGSIDAAARSRSISLAEFQIPMLSIPHKDLNQDVLRASSDAFFDRSMVRAVNEMVVEEMNAQYLCLALLRTQQNPDVKELKHDLALFADAYSTVLFQALSGITDDFPPYQSLRSEMQLLTYVPGIHNSADSLRLYAAGKERRAQIIAGLPEEAVLRDALIKSGMTGEEAKSYERRIRNLLYGIHQ